MGPANQRLCKELLEILRFLVKLIRAREGVVCLRGWHVGRTHNNLLIRACPFRTYKPSKPLVGYSKAALSLSTDDKNSRLAFLN